MKIVDRTLSLAPMLDWTDRHFRYLARLISPHLLLYTEMIPVGALLHSTPEQLAAGHLAYDPSEHPVALQLGGSEPVQIAAAAEIAAQAGFDEINLNVGCPSERVSAGAFGMALYKEPTKVAEAVARMVEKVVVPVTVKTRIGVDEIDQFDYLCRFVQMQQEAGAAAIIVHARMAYPSRYNPKQNRSIPPLQYEVVYALKKEFPNLPIVINGEITGVEQVKNHLQSVDGVMIGRALFARLQFLAELEQELYKSERTANEAAPSELQIVTEYLQYIETQWRQASPSVLIKPLFGLYRGQQGGRQWRQSLTQLLQRYNKEVCFEQISAQIMAAVPSAQ